MELTYVIIVAVSGVVVAGSASIILAIKCRRQPTQVRDWVSNPSVV
jgi:hypothetical protein